MKWLDEKSPSLEDFETIAEHSFAQLPQEFRDLCKDVIIRIIDFPEDDVLEEMQAETPFDLLGLFTGLGHAQSGDLPITGQLPNMIFLYRRPILDYWAEHDETLGHIIRHVLIHEIGHQVGLSDADMERIEAEVET